MENVEKKQDEIVVELPANFKYVLIALGLLYISTRLMKAGPSHIFALIAGYIIIQKLQRQEQESFSSFNQEMDYRLDLLKTFGHFHKDTDIINLFFNIYAWRERNENNFDLAIKAVNNILRVEADSEKPLVRCLDNYDIAYDQSKVALNLVTASFTPSPNHCWSPS